VYYLLGWPTAPRAFTPGAGILPGSPAGRSKYTEAHNAIGAIYLETDNMMRRSANSNRLKDFFIRRLILL